MHEKEEQILKEIINYYGKNKTMPTIRYLQKKFNYKSTNSVYLYLKSLEKNNYLKRNSNNKLILPDESLNYDTSLKVIKIVNSKETVSIILNKNKKYVGVKMKNDYFKDDGILKNDLLIIELNKKIHNNELGLFIINNKYKVMKYFYEDGFYLLKDKEEIILNKVKLIGKVIMIERKL